MKVLLLMVLLCLCGCAASRKSGPSQSAQVNEIQQRNWSLTLTPPVEKTTPCLRATTEVVR